MPFYRFEEFKDITYRTPRLSTGRGPVIEGQFIYFSLNCKEAGTGSQIHYHPNELLIFPLRGKINALVGRERRIVKPGTFIHVPPLGRHQMLATEDGPLAYLYIKDKTWTVVGLGAEDAIPEKPQTIDEALKEYKEAGWEAGKGASKKYKGQSSIRIDGLGNCYYPILNDLNEPACSSNRIYTVEGSHLTFSYNECLGKTEISSKKCEHEKFIYIIKGAMDINLDDEHKSGISGDIVHIPKDSQFNFNVKINEWVRYVTVSSNEKLEKTYKI